MNEYRTAMAEMMLEAYWGNVERARELLQLANRLWWENQGALQG